MGGLLGRAVGGVFFLALLIGALTSAISLLEVVTSSVIDEFGWDRKKAAIGMGALIAVVGIWPALDLNALGAYDSFTGNVLLPLGALAIALLVGWVMKNPIDELVLGSGERMRGFYKGWLWMLRIVAPALLLIVLWSTVPQAVAAIADLLG
jgi:NSS family neurotransmitter:Na+ symporter